jgi:hypothetical protein
LLVQEHQAEEAGRLKPILDDPVPFDLGVHQGRRLPDGLLIRLDQFTHKMLMDGGGPAKATAYFTVGADGVQDCISLSCTTHPGTGKPGTVDYDRCRGKAYDIELVGFECDRKVVLAIRRKPSPPKSV